MKAGGIAAIVILVLIILGGISIANRLPLVYGTSSTTSGTLTTLEDIIAGNFPSAADKQGTGGVAVTVRGLYVLYVHAESDGDWHVAVTDGRVSVFITEITPPYQSAEGMPSSGTTIDETGTPFCDTYHESETWHGSTCWEIHPVTSWHVSTLNVSGSNIVKPPLGLAALVSYAGNPIPRGATQDIFVNVTDSDGPVANASVYIHVLYASGETTKDFLCVTPQNGSCDESWTIGSDSIPGTFEVTVTVDGVTFDSSFEVTAS